MKPTTATFVVLLAAVCLVRCAYADLPVHCLNVQVAGKWLFEMSADNGHPYNTRCGHKVPDTNLDHFTKRGFDLEVVKQYTVTLHEPNIAEDDQHNFGTWTMVYDEGFEVLINGRSFFAFSKYLPKSPESLSKDDVEDYISVCDETLVGWFHNNDNTHWGCYHGKKIANSTAARFRSTKIAPARRQDNTPVLAPSKEIMEHNRAARAAATKPSFIAFSKTTTSSNKADFQNLAHDVLFEPDISFIELHNSDNSKLWRAGVHRHFIGRRMSEMMTMLGYRKREADVSQKKPMKDRPKAVPDHRPDHIKYHVLPKSFDWRHQNGVNYDSRVKNQGNCGSCYAMATISVAEARVRIKSKMRDQTLLSSQAVVSCSIYNQGCDGGYPYLVAKHAMDFGLVPEACMEYTAENGECKLMRSKHCRDPKNPPRYFASNYSYIGGYYGACNEVKMMEELYENGPIMVAFDAPSSLFYYTGGIYTGEKPPQEDEHVPGLNIWEKTNHAVVAVGWGEDKGVKYWIIKNTWGEDWGENGYFRIRRGTDECGVESMASTLDMVLPEFESNTHR